MAVLLSVGFKQWDATEGQTEFGVPFEFEKDEHVTVFKNTTKLTLTTDYTLSGAGSDSGGTVTLVAGATADDLITVRLDIPIERLVDFPQAGNFKSSSLNDELDRLFLLQKQLVSLMDRKIGFSDTAVVSNFVLPDPDAGKFWRVSADKRTFDQVDIASQGSLAVPIEISKGGTGSTTVSGAKTNLGFLDSDDIGVSVQAYDPDTLKADTSDELTAGYTVTAHTLTISSGTITPDFTTRNILKATLTENIMLANPSNTNVAGSWIIYLTEDATGGRAVTFGSDYKIASGEITTTADTVNILYVTSDGGGTYDVVIAQRGA